ncbi:MAG: hypothetical protein Q8T11_11245 [Elusimicrobiota bacterium]|nr:hypothetical protein [Elusimicrobiota bacterium]
MLQNGAVVLFGPSYLENSLQLVNGLKGAIPDLAILGCEKIADLRIPDGPLLNGSLIFFHRKPSHMDAGEWDSILLQGIDLRAFPPRRLGVGDRSPEEPTVELVPAGGAEMQLIVTWLRPLESGHLVRAARALERSYMEHGGQHDGSAT